MAKREFIDKKAFIDRSAIEFVSLEDSLHYMEWSKSNEVKLEMIATTITEQGIVKPYLEKLKAEIEKEAFTDVNNSKFISVNRVNQIFDKYKIESEDK